MIKAITFDLDGVYFVNGKSNFIKKLGEFGVSEEEAKRVFLSSDEMNFLYKTGKMSDEEFWSWAIQEWKLSMSVQEVIGLLIEGYEVDENVVEVVKKVRANGYKTLICTNNFPARINGLHKRFGFLDNFDVQVISYEVGVVKPQKEIFQKLVEKSGVAAEEILYADDSESAVVVAREVGITAELYKDFPAFVSSLKQLGVAVE
jgi:putative hydrolase of the HAD superfamily